MKGVLLLVLGAPVISGLDNVLRPLIVSGRTQLHPRVVFFSLPGGIHLLGAVGLIVGPVLFVAAPTLVGMGRRSLEPPGEAGRPGPPACASPPSHIPRATDGRGYLTLPDGLGAFAPPSPHGTRTSSSGRRGA